MRGNINEFLWDFVSLSWNYEIFKKILLLFQAGQLRIAKVNPNNPFGSGPMKTWYHPDCLFELKKTKTSKVIAGVADLDGWDLLADDDKELIMKKVGPTFKIESSPSKGKSSSAANSNKADSKDNLFSEFQRIVNKVAKEPSYNSKSQIIEKYISEVKISKRLMLRN